MRRRAKRSTCLSITPITISSKPCCAPKAATITTRLGTSHDSLGTPEEAIEDGPLLGKVADFFHRTFLNEPAAMNHFASRSCFHPEAAKIFRLGFANRTLGYRIPPQETAAGRALKAQLPSLGVLRGTAHEHLNVCVGFSCFRPNHTSWPGGDEVRGWQRTR